jgi:hypothetical protein
MTAFDVVDNPEFRKHSMIARLVSCLAGAEEIMSLGTLAVSQLSRTAVGRPSIMT